MDTATVPKFTVLIRKVEQISTNKSAKLTELKSHLIIMIYNKHYIQQHLEDCPDLLTDFHRLHPQAPRLLPQIAFAALPFRPRSSFTVIPDDPDHFWSDGVHYGSPSHVVENPP